MAQPWWWAWDRVRMQAGDTIDRIPAELHLPAYVPQTAPGVGAGGVLDHLCSGPESLLRLPPKAL